jgi:hypothetical protein
MALRIGKLCGNVPELWINMQRAYDLDAAEKALAHEIEKIPTLTAVARRVTTNFGEMSPECHRYQFQHGPWPSAIKSGHWQRS